MTDCARRAGRRGGRLDRRYDQLDAAAASGSGSLYDPADYPQRAAGLFDVGVGLPVGRAAGVPAAAAARQLYEQERARVAARFEEAVTLAEQASPGEFARTRRSPEPSASPAPPTASRRCSATRRWATCSEFFGRFPELNVRSTRSSTTWWSGRGGSWRGSSPSARRQPAAPRAGPRAARGRRAALDGLLVDKPRRRILRGDLTGKGTAGEGAAAHAPDADRRGPGRWAGELAACTASSSTSPVWARRSSGGRATSSRTNGGGGGRTCRRSGGRRWGRCAMERGDGRRRRRGSCNTGSSARADPGPSSVPPGSAADPDTNNSRDRNRKDGVHVRRRRR